MAGKVKCDCGCGRLVYHNQLTIVKVDEAIDETLRGTVTKKTFYVTRECKEAFLEELGLMAMLQMIVRKYPPPARTRWWLVNFWLNPFYPWPRLLGAWWRRVGGAVRIMKLQHAIYVRTMGFDYARTRAQHSAILFGAPRFLQGLLARRLTPRLKRATDEITKAKMDAQAAEKAA